MAELVGGAETRFALRPEGQLVGRHSDDGAYTPEVDLAVLEGGRTVSRRHARIYLRDGQWVLKVEAATTNPTVVAGHTLTTGQEVPLKDGDEIQLGRVAVLFRLTPEPAAVSQTAVVPPPVSKVEARAEFRLDGHAIPIVVAEGAELAVGRHSDDGTYRPDVDLADLPNGRTISRRHGRLAFHDGKWRFRVEAEVTNPTVLEGRRLNLGEEVPLADGDRLQLGRVIVSFHHLTRLQTVGPEQIELTVEPARVRLEAGAEEQAVVTAVNHTGHVDWFRIELEGIPQSWYRILLPDGTVASPAQVRLFHTPAHATPSPDAVAQLKIVYAPPRSSESRAGAHPIVVSATTQGEPNMRRATSTELHIERFESLEMKMDPEEVATPRGQFQIEVHNAGNDVATVALTPDGDGLVYQWDRPAANASAPQKTDSKLAELQQEAAAKGAPALPQRGKKETPPPVMPQVVLQLANGGREWVKLQTKVKRRHWLGTDRFYTFAVTAKAGQEEAARRSRLTCPPRIPIWMQTAYQRVQSLLVPIFILVAVLGIAFAFGRPADVKEFRAEPASVVVGTPVTLSWSLDRATGVAIEPASGSEQLTVPEGSLVVNPTASTRYTLTARNRIGLQSSRSVSVEVKPAPQLPRILAFTASAERIRKEGEAVTLRWETDGATKVTIEPADEVKDPKPSGEAAVHPSKGSTVYKLLASNDAGSKEATKTIVVDPPQVLSFTASPESIVQGGEVRLKWQAQGFARLTIKASKGEVVKGKPELEVPAGATDQPVRPLEDTEYTLTATNAGGSDSKTVKVTVSPMQIALFKAEPSSIARGEQTQLSWKVDGATSITIQPDVGAVAPGETSRLVKPDKTAEYTLTATGADGKQQQRKVTVTVGLGQVKVDVFTAAPPTIGPGQQAILTFGVQNAKRIVITDSDGRQVYARDIPAGQTSFVGNLGVSPQKTTTYTLTATNDSGQSLSSATVVFQPPTPTPPPAPPKP